MASTAPTVPAPTAVNVTLGAFAATLPALTGTGQLTIDGVTIEVPITIPAGLKVQIAAGVTAIFNMPAATVTFTADSDATVDSVTNVE